MIAGLKRCEINSIRRHLREWLTRPLGQLLLNAEREAVESVLANLFGYHLLQVGALLGDDLIAGSRVGHCVLLDADQDAAAVRPGVHAYADALPVATDSVDVVLLPHTLEFERAPHQVLREVERVLIPEGHVVVVGFNPWSLCGLWRLVLGRRRQPPWCGHFLSLVRLKDWVALLGFDIVTVKPFFFRPPVQGETVLRRLGFMEKLGARLWPRFAGVYVLVAKKRVTTLTPIKPRWRPRRALLGGLARPTTRSPARRCGDV